MVGANRTGRRQINAHLVHEGRTGWKREHERVVDGACRAEEDDSDSSEALQKPKDRVDMRSIRTYNEWVTLANHLCLSETKRVTEPCSRAGLGKDSIVRMSQTGKVREQ